MDRARALKIGLLAAAAALTVWLLADVRESRQFRISAIPAAPLPPTPTARDMQGAARAASASTVMVKPRYTGRDDAGHSWEVTADTADQRGTMSSSTLVLSRVAALWRDVSNSYTLSADQGDYDATAQKLALRGNVAGAGTGLDFTTPEATADLATRQVEGSKGVLLKGPLGGYDATLTARNFHLDATGKVLTFTQAVHLVLRK